MKTKIKFSFGIERNVGRIRGQKVSKEINYHFRRYVNQTNATSNWKFKTVTKELKIHFPQLYYYKERKQNVNLSQTSQNWRRALA